jgi:hypothetical protein
VNTSTIQPELDRRLDLCEQAIAAKLDHLAELQQREVQTDRPSMLPGADWVGLVPWILLTVLTTVSAVCWLVVWLAPVVR